MGRIKRKKKSKQHEKDMHKFGGKNEIKFLFLFNFTIIVVKIVNNNYKLFQLLTIIL